MSEEEKRYFPHHLINGGGQGEDPLKFLALWVYVEADFLREYHIELRKVWKDDNYEFSWRFFYTLMRGLSPNSTYNIMCDPAGDKPLDERPERIVDGDHMSDEALIALLPADKVNDQRKKR